MALRCILLLTVLVTLAWSTDPNDGKTTNATTIAPSLSFHVSSGGNENYFLRDNIASTQLLLTSVNNTRSSARRLVVALPAGNSGVLVYFLPLLDNGNIKAAHTPAATSGLSITLVNGSLTSTTDAYENVGAQADLAFSGSATLGVTIVGAIRAMRGTAVELPGGCH